MTKLANLVNKSGESIILGARLGVGGEGDVFDLSPAGQELAAKIYHKPLRPDQEEKLLAMVEGSDDDLKKIATWPIATLHLRNNGAVCGFLMPKVANYEPVHKLYSPAHRKQLFPKADWQYLITVARNVAGAFGTIHAHGHVIGDVNERNIFFTNNSVVKMIDCDSFQITSRGKSYLCEVGVPHFTPPELQSLKSFRERPRTTNHDNFGLAVLCFHLLLMGRHPYSGVYSGRDDMPIEKAIATSRFAFGIGSTLKGMAPPPNSVTMKIIPSQISDLFEQAFSEDQANGRPTPSQWVGALDYLRHNLRTCSYDSMHKYFGGLEDCPWCGLERQTGVTFFVSAVTSSASQTSFDLGSVWQRILFVPSPGECTVIDPSQFRATPTPFLKEIQIATRLVSARIMATKIAAAMIFVGMGLLYPQLFFFAPIVAVFLYNWAITNVPMQSERTLRQTVMTEAQRKWESTSRKWVTEAGVSSYINKLSELERCKREYEALQSEYKREKDKLQATIRQRQLQKYLGSYFIDDHTIPNIGPGRKATLVSFGVETAADLDRRRIQAIKGFGSTLTNELMQWRKHIESEFVFDVSKGIAPSDILALNQKYNQRRVMIENTILAGPEIRNKVRAEILQKRGALRSGVEQDAGALAQARADMSLLD